MSASTRWRVFVDMPRLEATPACRCRSAFAPPRLNRRHSRFACRYPTPSSGPACTKGNVPAFTRPSTSTRANSRALIAVRPNRDLHGRQLRGHF